MKLPNATCQECGDSFYKKPADKFRTKGEFCSRSCSGKNRMQVAANGFWERVGRTTNGCWPWLGSTNNTGYGTTRLFGKTVLAHRAAWTLVKGDVTNGLHVLHTCDNPVCVNPSHLFLGTHHDNMLDKKAKLRAGMILNMEEIRAIQESVDKPAVLATQYGVSVRTIRNYLKMPLPAPPKACETAVQS